MRNTYVLLLTICITSAVSLTGCVERKLTVKSSPPGADVYLTYTKQGKTPVTVPFKHYGARDVRLEKSGFRSKQTTIEPVAPFHSYFPLNFVTEVLLPMTIVDHQTFHIELEPYRLPGASRARSAPESPRDERDAVLERARELRGKHSSDENAPDDSGDD